MPAVLSAAERRLIEAQVDYHNKLAALVESTRTLHSVVDTSRRLRLVRTITAFTDDATAARNELVDLVRDIVDLSIDDDFAFQLAIVVELAHDVNAAQNALWASRSKRRRPRRPTIF